ncbi:MAG: hypothetical protein JW810_14420 [Sedimentisphaerales bacterium]|nr:hypothetical protein [Sedimentisphaerales bacterium]
MKYAPLAMLVNLLVLVGGGISACLADPPPEPDGASWVQCMRAIRSDLARLPSTINRFPEELADRLERLEAEFPIEWDWLLQDGGLEVWRRFAGADHTRPERALLEGVLAELGDEADVLRARLQTLIQEAVPYRNARWFVLYHQACQKRRALRLSPLRERWPRIVFTRHFDLGGSHYAYTEAQSDAQHERNFRPGSALCLWEMDQNQGHVQTLLEDADGVIRDPDVSYDGRRILFAWKQSDRRDDYHLYEMDVETRAVRQLTFGAGVADYEGVYLPGGDILFNSTRCVQIVDCWWTEVSNLYSCDADGRFLRRLGFDQVHTNFPTVLADGRVVYTRWDYNDRAQIYPQPLFVMNPDGTGQTEFYGNNSWFPTTILHARGIPGTQKILAVLSGHHTHQRGKLAVIDPARGRQENTGVQLIAPVRSTEAVRIDAYGQEGDQFQYPYPLDERHFLVTYSPYPGGNRRYPRPFGIYFMDDEGRRELLVWDEKLSCNQPIPLAPRRRPHVRPSMVDYRRDTGVYYLQDIYRGEGLTGVARGTVKALRVVALEFRAAGIGDVRNHGPGGGALASTPVGIGNTSWDVKKVLGEATVYPDGSALFSVPARTPLYFQALDERGRMVQTMRSWSTLQPNESFSCVGCHEPKNQAPPPGVAQTQAMRAGPQPLKPFYGPPRGFSFAREIQPILDRHCVRCHYDRPALQERLSGVALDLGDAAVAKFEPAAAAAAGSATEHSTVPAFSLLGAGNDDPLAKRKWSDAYLALTQAYGGDKERDRAYYCGDPDGRIVNWINVMSEPTLLSPYYRGSAKSELMDMLKTGHHDVTLSREESDKLACWIDLAVPFCGDYTEAHAWSAEEIEMYRQYAEKRQRLERQEAAAIADYIQWQDAKGDGVLSQSDGHKEH